MGAFSWPLLHVTSTEKIPTERNKPATHLNIMFYALHNEKSITGPRIICSGRHDRRLAQHVLAKYESQKFPLLQRCDLWSAVSLVAAKLKIVDWNSFRLFPDFLSQFV